MTTRTVWAVGIALTFLAFGGEALGQTSPFADRGVGQKTLLVTGATLGSVIYTPAKALYAAGGALGGATIFIMSAGQSSVAAGKTIARGARGDWFIHPDHLTGNRELVFRGAQGRQFARSR